MEEAEHVGTAVTFQILTDDTKKVIYRYEVGSALDHTATNLRILMTKQPTILSKTCRRVLVTLPRLTRIQLTNAAPTEGCNGESINSLI